MSIDTIRTGPEPDSDRSSGRRVLDVSDVAVDRLGAFVAGTDAERLHLERKGGRTYLVAE
jgi:hypothetical protein